MHGHTNIEFTKQKLTQLLNEISYKYQQVSAIHCSFSGWNPITNICWVVT